MTDERWREKALCAHVDPDVFFPVKGGSVTEAKAICSRCPVAQECLEFAMSNEGNEYYRHGVYGGLSPEERVALRRSA